MKKPLLYVTLAVIGLFSILSLANKGQAGLNKVLYDFKNAVVITETIVPMGKLIQKYSIGESGMYVKEETTNEINVFGIKRNETQINYTDRAKNILYNLQPNGEYSAMDISEMMAGVEKRQMYEFNKKNIEKFGGKIIGKEKYKGLNVTVVEYEEWESIVKYHKKYPVSMHSKAAGLEMQTELISFTEGVAKDYKLPKDAKVGEAQKIGDVLGQLNAYKNSPEYQKSLKENEKAQRDFVTAEDYQKYQNQDTSGNKTKNMPDIQNALKDAGPEVKDAMKALADMFGSQ